MESNICGSAANVDNHDSVTGADQIGFVMSS